MALLLFYWKSTLKLCRKRSKVRVSQQWPATGATACPSVGEGGDVSVAQGPSRRPCHSQQNHLASEGVYGCFLSCYLKVEFLLTHFTEGEIKSQRREIAHPWGSRGDKCRPGTKAPQLSNPGVQTHKAPYIMCSRALARRQAL